MKSILLLFIYLKSGDIKHICENLEPFLNMKEQDGIYFYRIMIILKSVFLLHIAESTFPKYVTWLMLTIANAFIVYKYRPVATVLVVLQCLIFLVSSKRLMLFISMALVCILSMNIKSSEFILDLSVTICMIIRAFQTYCNELQKLWTIVTIHFFIAWYVCSLHTFSVKQLFLIVCFLSLSYIPLKPDNKYRYRVLYFYVLVLILIVYKFQVINFHERKNLTDNSKFHKTWGCYESTATQNNIEEKSFFKKFQNPTMASISRGKLATKYKFDNLISYRGFRENTCRIDDEKKENMEVMGKEFKSNNGLPLQEKSFGKVTYDIKSISDEKRKGLELQFFKENNDKLRSLTPTVDLKPSNSPEKSLFVDNELILDSIQKTETKKEKRNEYKTTRKFNYLFVFNNKADKERLKNEENVIEYQKPSLQAPITLSKYKQKWLVIKKKLKVHSNLKRVTKPMDATIEKNREIKGILIPSSPVKLSKYKQKESITKEELKVDGNMKRETKTMKVTMNKKSKTRVIPSDAHMLEFATLTDIRRGNNLKRDHAELDKIKTYLKEDSLKIGSDTEQLAKQNRGNSNNKGQEKFQDIQASMFRKAGVHSESIELKNYAKLYDLIEQYRRNYNFVEDSKRNFGKDQAETIVPTLNSPIKIIQKPISYNQGKSRHKGKIMFIRHREKYPEKLASAKRLKEKFPKL